jgi:hypothetical protein
MNVYSEIKQAGRIYSGVKEKIFSLSPPLELGK